MTMSNHNDRDVLIHPAPIPQGKSGVLVSVSREQAGWETINFSVRRLAEGQVWQDDTGDEEAAFVVLGGRLSIDWQQGPHELGGRRSVFSGYPHAVYLPPHTAFAITALTTCEFADSRVRSEAKGLQPRVIGPAGIRNETRGGGNATRQILDIIQPGFPADRLLICEVFTPGGNWSSYPPHKHDVHSPPGEVDLDEIYYYRLSDPAGYALQRLYDPRSGRDQVVQARDGDLVLVHDGYHPVVAAHGYDVYYLNILAGSARSMAASDDPVYAHLRQQWPAPDPRVPMVHPEGE